MLRSLADKLDKTESNQENSQKDSHIEKPNGKAQMIVFYSEDEEKKQNEIERTGIKGLINKVNRILNG